MVSPGATSAWTGNLRRLCATTSQCAIWKALHHALFQAIPIFRHHEFIRNILIVFEAIEVHTLRG